VAATATRAGEYAQATASVIAATEVARATLDAQATITAQELRRLPIRPLRPGISIGGTTGFPGSLTGFTLSEDGRLNLLLPAIILGQVGSPIIQPSPRDGGQLENEVGRTSSRMLVPSASVIDAAELWSLAYLNPGVGVQVTIPGLGAIRGVREPQPGSEIRIISRSSDATTGRLPDDVSPGESFGLMGDLYGSFDGVIPLFGISLQAGDEGGLVVDEERFAVGVIVGAAAAPYEPPLSDVQLMMPLVDVMARFDATFLHQGQELATLTEAGRELKAVDISPDGRWLAGASFDTNVYLWDISAGLPLSSALVLDAHPRGVWDQVFSSDGQLLATAGIAIDVESGSQIYLWDLSAPDPAANPVRLGGGFGDIVDLAISPDDRWLAATGANNDIYLWDLLEGANRRVLLTGHLQDSVINELFFSLDGRWLASAGSDRTVRLWDLQAAAEVSSLGPASTLVDFDASVIFLTGSHDGRYLAATSANVVTLWDLSDGPAKPALVGWLEGHRERVTVAAFSPDDTVLATASDDGDIWLWRGRTFDEIGTLTGHTGAVRSLAFSPDGAWLASGSLDNTIRLWSMTTAQPGAEMLTLEGHTGPVRQLAFRPDGLWLASGGDDATIKLWQVK
jgi:WD40 repeat protein